MVTTSAVRASLAVGLPLGLPSAQTDVIYEGWVLKKRRKKMQGFARRYFTLHSSGELSYSFERGLPIRDRIALAHAAISTAPGRKDIHIDSNTATFHIKCLTEESFNEWMTVFRRFVSLGNEARRSASIRKATRMGSLSLKSGAVIEEMGLTITQLEQSILDLQLEYAQQKRHSIKEHSKDKHTKDHTKDSSGASVFGLFKRAHPQDSPTRPDLKHSTSSISTAPTDATHDTLTAPEDRIKGALSTLKLQHSLLVKSHHTFSHTIDPSSANTSMSAQQQSLRGSPLPEESEGEEDGLDLERRRRSCSTPTTHRQRASIHSDFSEWFDAEEAASDGAQEFVLDVQASPDDMSCNPSCIVSVTNDSRSSLGVQPDSLSNADTDSEAGEGKVFHHLQDTYSKNEALAPPATNVATVDEPTPRDKAMRVARRSQLPAKPVGDEGSLFAVLKKNVGKDLSTIALPCTFNEPLTLLQRAAEEVEYHSLLTLAASSTSPIDRISYIAAFVVAGYAHTRHRSGRKGFVPLLGETFEDARTGMFIAEKVVHSPLVMAYHAEYEGWELYGSASGKTKFWGKSLEIIPIGKTTVKIRNQQTGKLEAHYEWVRPSSFMRNLIVGKKYLEHVGITTVHDVLPNGLSCELDFKQGGYFGPSNIVSGRVLAPRSSSSHGKTLAELEGKWDEHFSHAINDSTFRVLWKASPCPKNTHDYYGFTTYAMTLNELTEDFKSSSDDKGYSALPLTDSRLRPDVRALEEGKLEEAEEEKMRVEEMQRERRREGKDVQPRWFKQVGDEWVYTGEYWKERVKGCKDVNSLW